METMNASSSSFASRIVQSEEYKHDNSKQISITLVSALRCSILVLLLNTLIVLPNSQCALRLRTSWAILPFPQPNDVRRPSCVIIGLSYSIDHSPNGIACNVMIFAEVSFKAKF